MVSEIHVDQLKCFGEYASLTSTIQFFVQVACPRLSIDWGKYYDKPLLTPYEFYTLIDKVDFNTDRRPSSPGYPMDYYSDNGGEWTNFYHRKKTEKKSAKQPVKLQFEEIPADGQPI